ncbi:hypothetical protein OKA05_09050 [Luteolibacter arcticus]|uniref:Uncharacterized protein n=1 Tax=Luteolibacter arcticus TaxID=1581411 RepID=A0ABT3GGJ5_9BACT|nr:hypothetical protein [Luteolibacter arcticus]MCW1922699.1 hypothetical protein [Luteolibacter arcticus]
MEQDKSGSPFKSELDLPRLSVNQAVAVMDIKEWGKGSYSRFANGHWLPANGDTLGSLVRSNIRQTDRTILSLIRNGYVQVAQTLNGKPVRVTLTFP